MHIIRKEEQRKLHKLLTESRSNVFFLSGRYRVGKTTMVRECCKNRFFFELTGSKNASLTEQLVRFGIELKAQLPESQTLVIPKSWEEAFGLLTGLIRQREDEEKKVIFLDELFWLAGKRSGFLEALKQWWKRISHSEELLLVLCCSKVSWMNELYEKWSQNDFKVEFCRLFPLTLFEAREFLQQRKVNLTNYQLLLLYMVTGGIPAYLEKIQAEKSAGENIQALFFEKRMGLNCEYQVLDELIFDRKGYTRRIFAMLAGHASGRTRMEILEALNERDGGWLTTLLYELEQSGFIRSIPPLNKRKKETVYRLDDLFVLFYLNFIASPHREKMDHWNPMQQATLYKDWASYAFENVCIAHLPQMLRRMGISGVKTRLASIVRQDRSLRFDCLLERKDGLLNVFRPYFHADHYSITVSETFGLNRMQKLLSACVKSGIEVTYIGISPYGIDDPTDTFEEQLGIECLFEP